MKSKNREFGMKKKQSVLLHRSMIGLLLSASSLALGACGTMGNAWDDATSVFSSSAPYAGDIKPTVSAAPAEGQTADKTAKAEPAPPAAVPAPTVAEEQVAAAPAPQPEPPIAAAEPVPAAPAQPEPAAQQVAAAEPAPAPAATDAAPVVPAYVPDNLRYLNGSGRPASAAEAAASQPYPNLAEVPPRPAPGPTAAQQQQEIARMQSGTATAAASQPVGAVMPAAPAAPPATPMPVMPEIPALADAIPAAAPFATSTAASPAEPMPAGAAPAPVAETAPASVADIYQRALNQRYQPGMAPVPPRVDPLLPPAAMAAPAPVAAMAAPATSVVMGPTALQVYFGNGGSKLAAADLSRLSQLAEKQKAAVARLKVSGYSSADGGGDAVTRAVRSLQLATDRANAVARQLVVFGVDPTMIEVEAATLPAGTAGKEGRRADIAFSQ